MKDTAKVTTNTVSAGKRKMLISVIKRVIAAVLLIVITFSVAKIINYFDQKAAADQMQNEIITEHVTPDDTQPSDPVDGEDSEETEDDATQETEPTVAETPVSTGGSAVDYSSGSDGITVDFASLTARYPGVVGYIYGPNTPIQYPIAYTSTTNDYYLNRDLDGNLNANGSIFIEHLNSPNFSDQNTIIYGHHMKSGLMFAGLVKYKDSSYYNAHPYFYIYTPTQNYRMNLFAGFVCAHDDEVFATALTYDQLARMAAKSTFNSNMGIPSGKLVTLCTCSYEFNNARYVIVGELVPIN